LIHKNHRIKGCEAKNVCQSHQIIWKLLPVIRFLRNFADASHGMLRVSAAFCDLRFLEETQRLRWTVLTLVLSLLNAFALIEHSNLEKIEFSAAIHASFNELKSIYIPF